jgi:tetratricopeptide (TPR) repeat protein
LCESGDLEGSLVEYKSAITIYENMMGKFHVKMAHIYTRIAGVLMDKGEYETALSFYAKAYGIFDGTLGLHDDTKQALMNVKLAAEKNRAAKSSMAILVKAEEAFKKRHPQLSGNDSDSASDNGATNKKGKDGKTTIKKNGDEKKKKKKKKKKKSSEEAEEKEPDPEPDII